MKTKPLERANRLLAAGKPRDALSEYQRHIVSCPADVEIIHRIAGIHYQLGELSAATAAFRHAAALQPENPDYISDLGAALLANKAWEEAEGCFRTALAGAPENAQIKCNLGHALAGAGKFDAAVACFREITVAQPNFVDAHFNLGKLMQEAGLLELAAQEYEAAIRLHPELAIAHFRLGEVFSQLDRKEAAIRCFRRTLQLAPHFVEARLALAGVLTENYRAAETIELLQGMTQPGQHSLSAMLHLGRAYEVLGDLENAETAYRSALEKFPNTAGPWIGLSSCKRVKADDQTDVRQLEKLVGSSNFDPGTRSALNFALGKMLDDCGRYDDAFASYRTANELRNALVKSGELDYAGLTDATIQFFTLEFIASKLNIGSSSNLPVFVVGMPRSGTTLVEQIISSHPKAHGAGELYYLPQLAHGLHVLLKTQSTVQFPDVCALLDPGTARQIVEPYLALLRWHSATAERVVDKMPTNFRYLGLIAILFPNAKIIHCARNPLDTCLSIYFHNFARGHEYAYDLAQIGTHYRNHYLRLMEHWQSVLPNRIYTCSYEKLVEDPPSQARALIDACALEWNDACLEFNRNRNQVRTASIAQVREGIYTRSRQRWRHYEKHIEPLMEALGYNKETSD